MLNYLDDLRAARGPKPAVEMRPHHGAHGYWHASLARLRPGRLHCLPLVLCRWPVSNVVALSSPRLSIDDALEASPGSTAQRVYWTSLALPPPTVLAGREQPHFSGAKHAPSGHTFVVCLNWEHIDRPGGWQAAWMWWADRDQGSRHLRPDARSAGPRPCVAAPSPGCMHAASESEDSGPRIVQHLQLAWTVSYRDGE